MLTNIMRLKDIIIYWKCVIVIWISATWSDSQKSLYSETELGRAQILFVTFKRENGQDEREALLIFD